MSLKKKIRWSKLLNFEEKKINKYLLCGELVEITDNLSHMLNANFVHIPIPCISPAVITHYAHDKCRHNLTMTLSWTFQAVNRWRITNDWMTLLWKVFPLCSISYSHKSQSRTSSDYDTRSITSI